MDHKRAFLSRRTLSGLFIVCCGIAFYMLLENFGAVRAQLDVIGHVVSPFVAALVLAYLLNMPMRFLENRVFHKLRHKRGFSILCVYLLALLALYALGSLVLPQIVNSVMQLVANMQLYMNNVNSFLDEVTTRFHLNETLMGLVQSGYEDLVQKGIALVRDAVPQVLNWSVSFGKGLVSTFTAVIASIYFLADKESLLFLGKKIVYAIAPAKRTARVLDVLRRANAVFSGFIGGKLVDSLIIGLLCFLGMSFIKPELAVLISVLIGITNIIPVFGPFIGAIPSIFLLLIIDPVSALWFALFILLLQQLDGNVIGPKILGDSTGLSALWVLIAIVVGGGLFGFTGMLVGVPVCSVLAYLLSDALQNRLTRKGIRAENGCLEAMAPPSEDAAPAQDAAES